MASSSVTVCSGFRDAPGRSTTRPASMESCTAATTSRSPSRATKASRKASTSGKLWPVSTCSSGNGTGAGQNALRARCSSTAESLPPENSSTGRADSAEGEVSAEVGADGVAVEHHHPPAGGAQAAGRSQRDGGLASAGQAGQPDGGAGGRHRFDPVSYTHLRAHETRHDLVCRLLLEK